MAIGRREAIDPAFQVVLDLADEVFPIERKDALRAGQIVQQPVRLSARDALHVAVMERHKIKTILSFDADFDRWPGLTRIGNV